MSDNQTPVAPKRPHGIHISATFQYPARCPDCGGELSNKTVHFQHGIAMCKKCVQQVVLKTSWLAFALRARNECVDWINSHGLSFWTPRHDGELGVVQWYSLHRHDSLNMLSIDDFPDDLN
jgi:hypothetical protein